MRATATAGPSLALAAALLLPASSVQPKPPAPAWEIAFDADTPRQIVAGAASVFSSNASVLEARSIDDGTQRWSRPYSGHATLISGDARLFAVSDGRIDAFDAATGDPQWSAELPAGAVQAGWGPGVIAAAVGTGVYLFNDADGSPRVSAGLEASLTHPPIVTDTMVVVAPDGDRLVGVDPVSGRRTWLARLESAPTTIAAQGDRVYVSGENGGLYCYRPPNARYDWRFSLYARASGPASADAASVFVALFDNTVQAIGRTSGTRRWSQTLSNRPSSAAVLSGERLLVAQADGTVAVIRATTGAPIAELRPPGETRQLQGAGLVPGSPSGFFTLTRGTSGTQRLTLWRLQP